MPLRLLSLAALLLASLLMSAPAQAGRYCTGSCASYVVVKPHVVHRPVARPHVVRPHVVRRSVFRPQIAVDRPHAIHRKRRVKRVHKVRRSHRVRRSHVRRAPRLHPRRGPIHMPGRTRFCSDYVEWHGHVGVRDCVQVRNDLVGRH